MIVHLFLFLFLISYLACDYRNVLLVVVIVVDLVVFFSVGLMKSNLVQPAIATGITNNLASLQDTVVNLERICNTPLPFAYQVHLRISLWYASLPFSVLSIN